MSVISTSAAFSSSIFILSSSFPVKCPPSFGVLFVRMMGIVVISFISFIISVAFDDVISCIVSNLSSI